MIYNKFIELEYVNESQQRGMCPFHEDTDPSFFVNDTGQWFCFGCNEGGGPVTFVQNLLGTSKAVSQYIVDFYNEHLKLPLPTEKQILLYQKKLQKEATVLAYLREIGATDEVVKKLRVGWDRGRLVFPIYTNNGYLVNLRKYLPPGSGDTRSRKTINVKKLGSNRYYPYCAFDEPIIYIVEGEKDMLVARSQGLNAVTSTGGRRIPLNEIPLFKGKLVYVMTDSDQVGDAVALQYSSVLKDVATEVHRIRLPYKDVADYYEQMHTLQDIKSYMTGFDPLEHMEAESVSLRDCLMSTSIDSLVNLKGMKIVGKHFNTYTIPRQLTINCSVENCKYKDCPYKGVDTLLDIEKRDVLRFIRNSDEAQQNVLLKYINCKKADITHKEYVNAQIVYFQEDITVMSTSDYFNQMQTGIYLFDTTHLDTNKTYDFTAIRTTDPRTQQVVFVILKAEELELSMEVDVKVLDYFQRLARKMSLEDLIDNYYQMWLPHLEVYGRKDLFTITLLTFLSAIGFYWGNTLIKGWLDSLIIGDTRTGKSKMIKNFIATLNLGTYVSGENARKTGIIGGVQKLGDNWTLNWGVVPLNDKRLVVIDEASGLTVEDIQELSQMRSEGILSITKIVQETTTARTRLIWLTNPRSGKQIGDFYWKGIDAIQEFLPVQEDLARFDIATTAALEDVDNIHIISEACPMDAHMLKLWRQLVVFAWNLSPENISISDEVRKHIIQQSDVLGNRYRGLPLFLKTNGYEKIARVAIALAILTFNMDKQTLVVEKEHVDYTVQIFTETYAKKSLKYEAYSHVEHMANAKTDEKTYKINQLLKMYENLPLLFEGSTVRSYIIQEVLGIDKDDANVLISQLLKLRLIKITPSGYKATQQFLNIIREITEEV